MRGSRREFWVILGLSAVAFVGVGLWLAAHDLVFPDAMSRVANGYFVAFSRDPHLAAIGFVWNPLPSFLDLPFLALTPLIPAMASHGLAGVLESSLCGALTVALFALVLRDIGVTGRAIRWILTGLFAVQPLIVLSSASGASEAMLLAALMLVLRSLLAYLRDNAPDHLLLVGVGLGLAYLTRYEAVGAGAGVIALVFVISALRHRENRMSYAFTDATIAAFPFVMACPGWAVVSKVIMGSWFESATSHYGNSSQVNAAREYIDNVAGTGHLSHLGYLGEQLAGIAPLLGVVAIISAIVAIRRRDVRVPAIWASFGTVLVLDDLLFLQGSTFGWLRFQIAAVPLLFLLAGHLVASTPRFRPLVSACTALALAACLPLAWRIEGDPRLAREEEMAVSIANSDRQGNQRAVAADLDLRVGGREGSVITDVAYSSQIVLASRHPDQYVVTTDRDFKQALADPAAAGVCYALVGAPESSPSDAVEAQYPQFFETGGGVATLEQQWTEEGPLEWRLYSFDHQSPGQEGCG